MRAGETDCRVGFAGVSSPWDSLRLQIASKGDGSPLRYQGRLAGALDDRTEDLASSMRRVDSDRVASVHLPDRHLELAGEGLGERRFHGPLELAQVTQVGGHAVVVHDASILRLVAGDDAVIAVRRQLLAVDRLAMPQVGLAFGRDTVAGNVQGWLPINGAFPLGVAPLIIAAKSMLVFDSTPPVNNVRPS